MRAMLPTNSLVGGSEGYAPPPQALGRHARVLHRPATSWMPAPPAASQRAGWPGLGAPAPAALLRGRSCGRPSCSACTRWSAACARWSRAWALRIRRRSPTLRTHMPLAANWLQGGCRECGWACGASSLSCARGKKFAFGGRRRTLAQHASALPLSCMAALQQICSRGVGRGCGWAWE